MSNLYQDNDPRDCSATCRMIGAHKHCASDGCILLGYQDGDGSVYADDKLNEAVKCTLCGELMHPECARQDGKVCAPCDRAEMDRFEEENIVGRNLNHIVEDLKTVNDKFVAGDVEQARISIADALRARDLLETFINAATRALLQAQTVAA